MTCTSVHEAGPDLERWADDLRADYRAGGGDGADPLPEDCEPLLAVELTTHAGHFLGRAIGRLVLFRDARGDEFLRDVGSWDPLT